MKKQKMQRYYSVRFSTLTDSPISRQECYAPYGDAQIGKSGPDYVFVKTRAEAIAAYRLWARGYLKGLREEIALVERTRRALGKPVNRRKS